MTILIWKKKNTKSKTLESSKTRQEGSRESFRSLLFFCSVLPPSPHSHSHPSIPPLHSASLPSLFYPLLFLSLPQIQNMSSLLPSPPLSLHPRVVTHTHQHTPTHFLFDRIAHVPVWRISISDVNIDSSSVGSQRLFHNEVHSLVSSVSLRKKKNGKKLWFSFFFFSVCQNFQEEMEILYRNTDMKNRNLKSCHYSLRLEFESCVCHMAGRTPSSDKLQPGPHSFVAGFIAPIWRTVHLLRIVLVSLLTNLFLLNVRFSSI